MIRLLYFIPLYILFLIFRTLVIIVGWIVVPLAAAFRAYELTDLNPDKPDDGPIYHFTWRFMFLWDNFEDGIANRNYYQAPNLFLQIVYWSAIRNPANNLRKIAWLSCKIVPDKVRFIGSFGNIEAYDNNYLGLNEINAYDTPVPQWFFAWQGLYSNFYWQFNLFGQLRRFWIGWKIMPQDIYGLKPTSHRINGAGFATQFKRIKQ